MTAAAHLTLDQFLALPETEPASEYVCGQVQQKPMPNYQHSRLQLRIASRLDHYVETHGLGVIGTELRCIFGPPGQERALVPDVCYITEEHLPPGDSYEPGSHYGPPDIAVEVLSPDQGMTAFADKIQFYLANGVRLIWVADPQDGGITVHAPGEPPRRLSSGDTLDGGSVLPGFTLPVDEIFGALKRHQTRGH